MKRAIGYLVYSEETPNMYFFQQHALTLNDIDDGLRAFPIFADSDMIGYNAVQPPAPSSYTVQPVPTIVKPSSMPLEGLKVT